MTGNQIAYWRYAEDARHNAEMESQGRINLSETARHNLANEALQSRQIGLGYAQLAETRRANQARELIQTNELKETARSNRAKEYETRRSNTAREMETHRSNTVKEEETQRHNEQVERNDLYAINTKHTEWATQHKFNVANTMFVQNPIEVGKLVSNSVGNMVRLITSAAS